MDYRSKKAQEAFLACSNLHFFQRRVENCLKNLCADFDSLTRNSFFYFYLTNLGYHALRVLPGRAHLFWIDPHKIQQSKINNMTNTEEGNEMLATLSHVTSMCAEAERHYQSAMKQQLQGEQLKRSKYLNRAVESSERGTCVLYTAFSLIPEECMVRDHYPEEMDAIGITSIPKLQGINFGDVMLTHEVGGRFGSYIMNDCKAHNKIKMNKQILQQSLGICDQQQRLLSLLIAHIQREKARPIDPPAAYIRVV